MRQLEASRQGKAHFDDRNAQQEEGSDQPVVGHELPKHFEEAAVNLKHNLDGNGEFHPYPNEYQCKFAKLCADANINNTLMRGKVLMFLRETHHVNAEDIPKSTLDMHQRAARVRGHIEASTSGARNSPACACQGCQSCSMCVEVVLHVPLTHR